jgi:hypothetical protein
VILGAEAVSEPGEPAVKFGPEGDAAGDRERQADGAEARNVLLLDPAVDAAGFGKCQLEAPADGASADEHRSGRISRRIEKRKISYHYTAWQGQARFHRAPQESATSFFS